VIDGAERLKMALQQWRDSLINLTGNNRLLNYRPTRSSTIEFADLSPLQILDRIAQGTFVIGTRPTAAPEKDTEPGPDDTGEALEDLVLAEIEEFDYSAFPNHLFVNKTQKDVDRALKNLDAYARREFLDKGLTTLYAAFGAIRWKEESGDERLSPLILIPVKLESDGPKRPSRVLPSEDDPSGNPALALRFADFGVELPSSDQIRDSLEDGGIDAALSLFSRLELPDGWRVEDFSVLSIFMFAKEAMYRDLLDNEQLALANPLLQGIAGGLETSDASLFAFEPIDEDEIDVVAPPESAPLVRDADSSQRVAIEAARAGRSFVLDGPPGTGKSQTIANIIASSIADGKTVLFVSEKAVALDVVKDRLSERGLDPFLFELHSHKATRKDVAMRLGRALDLAPLPPVGLSDASIERARREREDLSSYADAMNEIRSPLNRSLHDVLGMISQRHTTRPTPPTQITIDSFDGRQLSTIQDAAVTLVRHWPVALEGKNALWWGLTRLESLQFDLEDALTSLDNLESITSTGRPLTTAFSVTEIDRLPRLAALCADWDAGADFCDARWLTVVDADELSQTVDEFVALSKRVVEAGEAASGAAGPQWRELPVVAVADVPTASPELVEMVENWPQLDSDAFQTCSEQLREQQRDVRGIADLARSLATLAGLAAPTGAYAASSLLEATAAMLADAPPLPDWVTDDAVHARIEHLVPALKEANETQAALAAEASAYFTDDVLGLPITDLNARLIEHPGLMGGLRSETRRDRKTVKGVSRSPLKVALTQLPLAAKWHAARAELVRLEASSAPELGSYYHGAGSDWAALACAVANAERVRSASLVVDHLAFSTALTHKQTNTLVRQLRAELEAKLQTAEQYTQNATFQIPNRVQAEDFESAYAYAGRAAESADQLQAFVQKFTNPTSHNLTAGVALLRARLRSDAEAELDRARLLLPGLAAVCGELPDENQMNTALAGALTLKRDWTLRIRELVADIDPRSDKKGPLTGQQFAALGDTRWPAVFSDAYTKWDRSRERIESAFAAERRVDLRVDLNTFPVARVQLAELGADKGGPSDWFDYQGALRILHAAGMGRVVEYAVENQFAASEVADFLVRAALTTWVETQLRNDQRLATANGDARDTVAQAFRDLDPQLLNNAIGSIVRAGNARRPRTATGQASLLRAEAEKKRKHLPIRRLVERSRDVIQGIHPCFMMSPLAVSQYLPPDITFDLVIFDEASQVTPGDAINCIYRGRALIAAGDQKQLPPTSFFASASPVDEDDEEDDLANDYESILDLMKGSGAFNALTLRWHYRSRHEHLIAFSNASFYDNRLITFPGAIAESADMGVKFFHIPDGVYRRSAGRDNPIEARAVARRVIHHFIERPGLSLGVVTFSADQRDAVMNAVELERGAHSELDGHFAEDRMDGFFVKSLESVQGDERDVILFSVGYGPDESGKVYKQFGPLIRAGGERRLNVAVTRARQLVEVVSSMTAADIGEVMNAGGRHLRRYLDFAERGPSALALELGSEGLGTDSPFEDSVIDSIRSWGFDVQPQVGVSGFRIDIGVKHPNQPGAFLLGVECDGAMYHSSRTARDRDRLRHDILEGLGWKLHHIWGTAWYRQREVEEARLRNLLEDLATRPVVGRMVEPAAAPVVSHVELDYEPVDLDLEPDWVAPYVKANPSPIASWVDVSDTANSFSLVSFVNEVVEAEGPIHMEVLTARLREAKGLGRAGARIMETLRLAVKRSNVDLIDDFVWPHERSALLVRSPIPDVARPIEQVADEELALAICNLVVDSGGAARSHVVERVSRIFGWRRTSAGMTARFGVLIDALVRGGRLTESEAGLRSA
jgi:hypothetical protein